jgi:hypothetical protein
MPAAYKQAAYATIVGTMLHGRRAYVSVLILVCRLAYHGDVVARRHGRSCVLAASRKRREPSLTEALLVLTRLLQTLLILTQYFSFVGSQLALNLLLPIRKLRIVARKLLRISPKVTHGGFRVPGGWLRSCIQVVHHRPVAVEILVGSLRSGFALERGPNTRRRASRGRRSNLLLR